MPSFFGYMAWSGVILLPLFGLVTWLFFLVTVARLSGGRKRAGAGVEQLAAGRAAGDSSCSALWPDAPSAIMAAPSASASASTMCAWRAARADAMRDRVDAVLGEKVGGIARRAAARRASSLATETHMHLAAIRQARAGSACAGRVTRSRCRRRRHDRARLAASAPDRRGAGAGSPSAVAARSRRVVSAKSK